MGRTRPVIRGNTVYEIDKFSKKPKHIIHGVDEYFKMRHGEEELNETPDISEPILPDIRRKQLLKLAGNKRKLVSKADGLDKEISIDETEHESKPDKYIKYDPKYRKNKKLSKPKRKIKKCRCKK